MTGRIIHYSEPVEFHKAMPGAKSVVIWKRVERQNLPPAGGFTPLVTSTADDKVTRKVNSMTSYNL